MVRAGTVFWVVVLIVAVWVAHWGATQIASPLEQLRRRWGLAAAGGGAIVGLAFAMPEVSITTSSVLMRASNVGLGLMIGGNVLSLPLLTSVAYLASWRASSDDEVEESTDPGGDDTDEGRETRRLWVEPEAVGVVGVPYVGIVLLVAALTVPLPWRGLQPVDGWIMLAAYGAYLAQSLFRGRTQGDDGVNVSTSELGRAALGLVAVVTAAAAIVHSTEQLVRTFGVSSLFGGLFITAPMGLAPEAFGTWSVTRSGQLTAGTVDVITDGAVTMTLAFFPLALVSTSIDHFQLYVVSLLFAIVMPVVYIGFLAWQRHGVGFTRWQVLLFDGTYLIYVVVVAVWMLGID